ncbi:nuclear receptor subfamily 2 group E member 1 [Cryptotermes secundus]|uniref:nuclear receptor subfamily 2 group E member 1 n=1 Tax=Cryptotermes secundus TaxID=105785 RepID=UPI000CD7B6FF|nr:nuclear receptor subfamily 2 group E member 1 [Cryptotermes secundus]
MRGEKERSTGRILYDIPCKVCQDHSSGKHYGIFACDGCAGFFKRSIRRQRQYVCKAKSEGSCVVDKTHRNQCRACRLRKCVQAGMNKDAVQHERGPRNSTLRRQMALFYKEPNSPPPGDLAGGLGVASVPPLIHPAPPHPSVLDLAMPKVPRPEPYHMLLPTANFFCSPAAVAATAALQKLPLGLTLPAPFPSHTTETLCESAARLLFTNVKWAKNVPAFTGLNFNDQLLLLEQSWRELFVLGAAQYLLPLELSQLVSFHGALTHRDSEHAVALLHEVKVFQDTLSKFKQLHVDPHEYACLRAIVLFRTNDVDNGNSSSSSSKSNTPGTDDRTLVDAAAVAALQDHTQLTLSKYIATAHPDQPLRFGKLLLLLPTLRTVSAATIEELFFRRTIGNIPIERIICDMYKTSDI